LTGLAVTAGVLALAAAGAPVYVLIGGLALLLFRLSGTDLSAVIVELMRLSSLPALIAIPLFTFAGFALAESKAPARMLRLSRAWLGWLPGGIALGALATTALFTAFTGASGVTIIALGGLLYPMLRAQGYREGFTLGLLTTTGSLGLLFPPSLPIILYGLVAKVSIDKLFAAGLVPGLLLLFILFLYSLKEGSSAGVERVPFDRAEGWASLRESAWELPLPFPELSGDMPLLPARMVNEYQHCPRLAYLEWVQGEWAESSDTVQGRHAHRRVDKPSGDLPDPAAEEPERVHARSITLSSNRLGLIAKMDLVEGEGNRVTPVDYKRGKRPHVPQGAYEPERVQLCVQGLILEEHGYECSEGVLYFVESKERVRIPFDEELRALTKNAIDGLRLIAVGGTIPPPLEDSPKCPRCSLVGICLPDEVNFLKKEQTPPRSLAVARDEALPIYVQARSAKVAKKGETLEISVEDKVVQTARLIDASQLVLMGNVYVTTPTLHELMAREITISWHSFGGWFLGHTVGTGHKNVEIRAAQYRASFDGAACRTAGKAAAEFSGIRLNHPEIYRFCPSRY